MKSFLLNKVGTSLQDMEMLFCGGAPVCSIVSTFATSWTIAHQIPLSMEFSQEYWSRLPFFFQGSFLTQGWNSFTCLQHGHVDSFYY